MLIYAPISFGELIDKILILRLKSFLFSDQEALSDVKFELSHLESILNNCDVDEECYELDLSELSNIHSQLWEAEICVRECISSGIFDTGFASTVSKIVELNKRRGAIKYSLNVMVGSDICEHKNYDR